MLCIYSADTINSTNNLNFALGGPPAHLCLERFPGQPIID